VCDDDDLDDDTVDDVDDILCVCVCTVKYLYAANLLIDFLYLYYVMTD